MPRPIAPILSLAFAAPMLGAADAPADLDGALFAQLTFRERIVIRIPRLPPAPPPSRAAARAETATVWSERKAPKCVAAAVLAGASINGEGDVDLVATDGRRLRAKLDDDCPTLNFYRGFYLKRTADGMICAKRDALRSRSGARCEIARFRTLVAKR